MCTYTSYHICLWSSANCIESVYVVLFTQFLPSAIIRQIVVVLNNARGRCRFPFKKRDNFFSITVYIHKNNNNNNTKSKRLQFFFFFYILFDFFELSRLMIIAYKYMIIISPLKDRYLFALSPSVVSHVWHAHYAMDYIITVHLYNAVFNLCNTPFGFFEDVSDSASNVYAVIRVVYFYAENSKLRILSKRIIFHFWTIYPLRSYCCVIAVNPLGLRIRIRN